MKMSLAVFVAIWSLSSSAFASGCAFGIKDTSNGGSEAKFNWDRIDKSAQSTTYIKNIEINGVSYLATAFLAKDNYADIGVLKNNSSEAEGAQGFFASKYVPGRMNDLVFTKQVNGTQSAEISCGPGISRDGSK